MRRRYVIASALGLSLAGLFGLSAGVRSWESEWRESGVRLGSGAQVAVDLGLWWGSYGWAVSLVVLQLLLAAGLWRRVHRVVDRIGQSAEARDFDDGPPDSDRP